MLARRTRHALLAAAASLALSHAALAAEDAVAKNEIDHLLNFVGASSCTFVRNGTEYAADKAREHLASKYRFVGARITTADDFIKYLGTGSSVSGEPYHVKCGQAELPSGAWLSDELARYRKVARTQATR